MNASYEKVKFSREGEREDDDGGEILSSKRIEYPFHTESVYMWKRVENIVCKSERGTYRHTHTHIHYYYYYDDDYYYYNYKLLR